MICLNVLEHADPRYGGIATSVPALASAVSAEGRYQVRNAAFCDSSERPGEEFITLPGSRFDWMTSPAARRSFDSLVEAADLIHIHGLWRQHSFSACHAARARRKPYIVSAHGMLEPWALRNKGWKKRLYGALIERRNLGRAACLRALTRREAEDYRRYGVRMPITVVPNGIGLPPAASPELFLSAYPDLRGRRLVLFLSRVHRKKGLDVLFRAWARVPRGPADHLVIAGPDFENTQAALPQVESVTFTGLLDPELKWSALAAAHVFILPSYSEGFSVAVLEALAAGVPVIASKACNFPELSESGCGWVVEPEVPPVTDALAAALGCGESARRSMGSNGRDLVSRRFAWPRVAAQMTAVYDWALGGPRPSNVEIFE